MTETYKAEEIKRKKMVESMTLDSSRLHWFTCSFNLLCRPKDQRIDEHVLPSRFTYVANTFTPSYRFSMFRELGPVGKLYAPYFEAGNPLVLILEVGEPTLFSGGLFQQIPLQ